MLLKIASLHLHWAISFVVKWLIESRIVSPKLLELGKLGCWLAKASQT
jgi:hypothetical protein